MPSSLLFDKKTLSQAEQKINKPAFLDEHTAYQWAPLVYVKCLLRGALLLLHLDGTKRCLGCVGGISSELWSHLRKQTWISTLQDEIVAQRGNMTCLAHTARGGGAGHLCTGQPLTQPDLKAFAKQ
jgi:hypothetical protein